MIVTMMMVEPKAQKIVVIHKYLSPLRLLSALFIRQGPQQFSSVPSFVRMFKLIKGCTPSEYRSITRPGSSRAGTEAELRPSGS